MGPVVSIVAPSTRLVFDITDLILRETFSRIHGGSTSRALLAMHWRIADGGLETAKPTTNPALLRVAVRREEGGQVESWVSESVGGAEHA